MGLNLSSVPFILPIPTLAFKEDVWVGKLTEYQIQSGRMLNGDREEVSRRQEGQNKAGCP
jgi:hypothetical protein